MATRFLLDSNVLSEPTKPLPNPRVTERIYTLWAQITTAAPAWEEMLYGCFLLPESRRRTDLERYLFQTLAPYLTILSYDQAAAEWHASERARLGRIGRTPPFVDGQIASVARIHGLILVPANVSDFQNFEGLQVEDWSQ